jgi:hypothetical protein
MAPDKLDSNQICVWYDDNQLETISKEEGK